MPGFLKKSLILRQGSDNYYRGYGERGGAAVRGTGVTSAEARTAHNSADNRHVRMAVYDERLAHADASAAADAGASGIGVAVGCYSTATDRDCPARVADARVVRAADARSVALAGSCHNAAAYVNGAARAGDTCVGLAGINRVRLSARCTVCSDLPHLWYWSR